MRCVSLHIDNLKGHNAHHQCETIFKAFGRALRMALTPDPRSAGVIPSTKGSPLTWPRPLAVVDYGMGNLRSVSQAVMHVAAGEGVDQVIVTQRPEDVRAAERVVLPGQGAMRDCMRELHDSGLKDAVLEAAASKPLMGVCVGMQMLLDHSEEQDTPGLGLIPGRVLRFRLEGRLQPDGSRYKVPQMGWNQVFAQAHGGALHPVWAGRARRQLVLLRAQLPCRTVRPAPQRRRLTDYGERFTCAVARDNIFATQFHPEKSADQGLALYRNFLAWKP